MGLGILFNQDYLPFGVTEIIDWNPERAPHVVVVGATGSGKTYLQNYY